LSFDEGETAIEILEASPDLLAAIKNRSCIESQLEEAYGILVNLPLLSPTFFLGVPELQTETVMGFRANTGI